MVLPMHASVATGGATFEEGSGNKQLHSSDLSQKINDLRDNQILQETPQEPSKDLSQRVDVAESAIKRRIELGQLVQNRGEEGSNQFVKIAGKLIEILNERDEQNVQLGEQIIQEKGAKIRAMVAEEAELGALSSLLVSNLKQKLEDKFQNALEEWRRAPPPTYFGRRFATRDVRELKESAISWVKIYEKTDIHPIPSYLMSSRKDILDWLSNEDLFSGRFISVEPSDKREFHLSILPFPEKIQELLKQSADFMHVWNIASLLERLNQGSVQIKLSLDEEVKEHPLGGHFVRAKNRFNFILSVIFTFSNEEPICLMKQSLQTPRRSTPIFTDLILEGTGLEPSFPESSNAIDGDFFWIGYELSYVMTSCWFHDPLWLSNLEMTPEGKTIEERLKEVFVKNGIEHDEAVSSGGHCETNKNQARLDMQMICAQRESVTSDRKHEEEVHALEREFAILDEKFRDLCKSQIGFLGDKGYYALAGDSSIGISWCVPGQRTTTFGFFPDRARDYICKTVLAPLPLDKLDPSSLISWMRESIKQSRFEGRFAVIEESGVYQTKDFLQKRMILPLQDYPISDSLVLASLLERLGNGFLHAEATLRHPSSNSSDPHYLTIQWFLLRKIQGIGKKRAADLFQTDSFALQANCSGIPRSRKCQSSVLFSRIISVSSNQRGDPETINWVAPWIWEAWRNRTLESREEPVYSQLENLAGETVSYVRGDAVEDASDSEEVSSNPYYEKEKEKQKKIMQMKRRVSRAKERVCVEKGYIERLDALQNGDERDGTFERPSIEIPCEEVKPWVRGFDSLPEQLGITDYAYYPNKTSETTKKEISKMDRVSLEALNLLGLSLDERDFKLIKKAYRKISLKVHPDKGGDPKVFHSISKAYQTLEEWFTKDQSTSEFYFSKEVGVEEAYMEAFAYLRQNFIHKPESLSLEKVKEAFVRIDQFRDQLTPMYEQNLGKLDELKLSFRRTHDEIINYQLFFRGILELAISNRPDDKLINHLRESIENLVAKENRIAPPEHLLNESLPEYPFFSNQEKIILKESLNQLSVKSSRIEISRFINICLSILSIDETSELKDKIEALKSFLFEISEKQEKILQDLNTHFIFFEKLYVTSTGYFVFYQISHEVLSLIPPSSDLSLMERFQYLQECLRILGTIEDSPFMEVWNYENESLPFYLFNLILSKKLSLQRATAELAIHMGLTHTLFNLQQQSFKLANLLIVGPARIRRIIDQYECTFREKTEKYKTSSHSTQKNSSTEISDNQIALCLKNDTENGAPPPSVSTEKDESKTHSAFPPPFEEDSEISIERELLRKRIVENFLYFEKLKIELPIIPERLPEK